MKKLLFISILLFTALAVPKKAWNDCVAQCPSPLDDANCGDDCQAINTKFEEVYTDETKCQELSTAITNAGDADDVDSFLIYECSSLQYDELKDEPIVTTFFECKYYKCIDEQFPEIEDDEGVNDPFNFNDDDDDDDGPPFILGTYAHFMLCTKGCPSIKCVEDDHKAKG